MSAVLELARELIRIDTVNPPGREAAAADVLARRLAGAGFSITEHELAPGRPTVIARLGGGGPPLCLSGHLDTVPVGARPWTRDPFGAEVEGDLLYGRGSSDMKGAVAALVVAAERLAAEGAGPLMLVLTAGEERACEGARALAADAGALGDAGALLVAEPTGNRVCVAHKGVLWLRASTTGRSAHGSAPELGVNAIAPLARALVALEAWRAPGEPHPLLGAASLNIGTVTAGTAINSVPDHAAAELDLRTLPGQDGGTLVPALAAVMGPDVALETLLDLPAVVSDPAHPWIADTLRIASMTRPEALPYFTDASALAPALGDPPVVICGPGDAAQAHVTDEHCSIAALEAATELYTEIGRRFSRAGTGS